MLLHVIGPFANDGDGYFHAVGECDGASEGGYVGIVAEAHLEVVVLEACIGHQRIGHPPAEAGHEVGAGVLGRHLEISAEHPFLGVALAHVDEVGGEYHIVCRC